MIYIIRHGQTERNKEKLLLGRTDVPLNETGRQQAEGVKEYFREKNISLDLVFTSPLIRAVQTAEILAPDIPAVKDDRLIEMEYGPYEGVDLMKLPPELIFFFKDFVNNPAPEGMEALDDLVKRTGAFIEENCRMDKNILISTHAIAMKGILEYLSPGSKGSYWSKYIGNCSVYVTEFKAGSFTVPYEFC